MSICIFFFQLLTKLGVTIVALTFVLVVSVSFFLNVLQTDAQTYIHYIQAPSFGVIYFISTETPSSAKALPLYAEALLEVDLVLSKQ